MTALTLLTVGQALAATTVPPTSLGAATPADKGLEYREVTALTADGVTLSAWYIPSANGAAVVLRHGAGSTRTDTLDQAAVLAQGGYGVLMMDARGHGLSAGRAMDFGWYGDQDIRAGVDFLASQPDVDGGRIGVVGLSMGGEEAIGAAAADPRIRAVVAEGASQRRPADKQWLSDVYGAPGVIQEQLDRLTYGVTDLLTPADPPTPLRRAAAAGLTRPDAADRRRRRPRRGARRHLDPRRVPGLGHPLGRPRGRTYRRPAHRNPSTGSAGSLSSSTQR